MSIETKAAIVNGITPQSASAAGFHHHLPQIPTMSRNPKIAQSKASAKNAVASPEKDETQLVNIVQIREETKDDKSESAAKGQDTPSDKAMSPHDMSAPKEKEEEKPKQVIRQPPKKSRHSYDVPPQDTAVASRQKRQIKKKVPIDEMFTSGKPKKVPKADSPVSPKVQSPPKAIEESAPTRYLVGDLLWAKVTGHPFWPCMVSYDPFISIYTRLRVSGVQKAMRSYHVQFFGNEGERGWVNEPTVIPFEGKEKFFKRAEDLIENAPKAMKGKVMNMYKVNAARRPAWEIGVSSAEEALTLDINERIQQYTFVYEIPQSKMPKTPNSVKKSDGQAKSKRGRKRKQPEDSEEEDDKRNSTPKKRKVADGDSTKSPTVPHKVTKYDGSFESFCHKHRESVLDDYPDYDEEQVVEYLHQQWCMMTKEQKARYTTSKHTGAEPEEKATPGGSKRSSRVSKPSVRKLEAEEGSKLFHDIVTKKQKKIPSKEKSDRTSGRPVRETRRVIKMDLDEEDEEEDGKSGSESTQAVKKEESGPPHQDGTKSRRGNKGTTEKMEIGGVADESTAHKSESEATVKTESAAQPEVTEVKKKRGSRAKSHLVETQDHSDSGSDAQMDMKVIKPLKMPKDADPDLDLEIFKLNASDNSKREPICLICEQVGDLIECTGACQGHYHKECLGLVQDPPTDFKCAECQSGIHVCFSCKKSEGEVRRCSVSQCGRFYHEDCVVKYPQTHVEGKKFTCPLHACATCVAENNKNPKATKGRLYRCVRCPTAYHVGDYCIAAGSKNLPGLNIVCSNHFQPKKTQAHHSHVNVSWCFICSQGGTLLCCESCPAAFHAQCLKIEFPQGSWYCHTCRSGKKPLYGDIIWVKLGNYRWWPGEICHPQNVPTNIQEKPHDVGEFPVKFLGSRDYFWLYQGRVFLFQEGDKGSRDSTTKGIAKIFAKGVKEATEAFKIWRQAKENREQIEQERNDKKPAPFKFIKTNVPIGNVVIHKAEPGDVPRCECTPDMPNPCTQEANCLNTILMYECHPQTCPAGEKCQNQRFQKRQYPESTSFKTSTRGWGLKTLVDIKKGQFVNEYVGDLVDEEECKRRIQQAHEDNISNFYMLTLDKNRIIDACPKGNLSRFMNHCCSPNCETQKWTVNGDIRVGLFALKDIPKDSELTFNYNLDCLGNDKKTCICGAPNCSGFLGVRPKTAAAVANEKRGKEPKKKKRKKKLEVKKEHEDECFRCGEGGELVMCDKSNCPKSYHLQCLNLARPPHGKWLCPWHHCDTCGKIAKKLCSECPNSFCINHIEDNIFKVDSLLVCHEHADILEGKTLGTIDTMSETSASDSCVGSVRDEKDLANVKELEEEEMDTGLKNGKENTEKGNSLTAPVDKDNDDKPAIPHPAKSGLTVDRKLLVGSFNRNMPQQQQEKRKYKTVVNSARKANIRANLQTDNDNGKKDEKVTKQKANSGSNKGRGRPRKQSGNALPDSGVKDSIPSAAPLFDDSDEDQFSNLVIDIPTF